MDDPERLAVFPDAAVRARPLLAIRHATALMYRRHLDAAESRLVDAERAIEARAIDNNRAAVLGWVATIRSHLARIAGDLDRCLADVSEALAAFQADLEARGLAHRVLTFVWSEFGRRAEQNASGGTDHGAGGVAWVQGPRARSGILSDYPDLRRLDKHGNLAVTVDFRRVYCSLLEQWLGHDADGIIPGASSFARPTLVK